MQLPDIDIASPEAIPVAMAIESDTDEAWNDFQDSKIKFDLNFESSQRNELIPVALALEYDTEEAWNDFQDSKIKYEKEFESSFIDLLV